VTAKYFHQLNYTMANEDTHLEFEMIKALESKSILTIGGSGSRALPFLALPVENLKIVDVSLLQVKLIQFKLETIRQLSRADALKFWIGEEPEARRNIVSKMKLDSDLKDFIDTQLDLNGDKSPPLYWGKWEKTFLTFSKIASFLYNEKTRRDLFDSKDPLGFYQKNIKGIKWTLLLRLVGNSAIFNSLLYKGHFIKKNSELSYFDYYQRSFERLFALDIKRSHFLQICFFWQSPS
jgi:S-adenosylmethionine-diacylglycerol 3-amino-3-carboxypropyl transferase